MEFEECVISPTPLCEMTHFLFERSWNNPPFYVRYRTDNGRFYPYNEQANIHDTQF